MRAYIAYVKKDGSIKSVLVKYNGELDSLGVELNEYFKDFSDVKDLVVSTIKSIDEGEIHYRDDLEYLSEEDYDFLEYDSKEDFIEDFEQDTYYYLYEDHIWYIVKPNQSEFNDLEITIEEEY